jgi:hypothetical protein
MTTRPTPSAKRVRVSDPMRAADFNAVVADLERIDRLYVASSGVGGYGRGVGGPTIRLEGPLPLQWGGGALCAYWGRITAVHGGSPGTPVRGGAVRYSAAVVYMSETAVLTNHFPELIRDYDASTPIETTPLILPASPGDECWFVRGLDYEGSMYVKLAVLTERTVRRVCPSSVPSP